MTDICLMAHIEGSVQGVGFRYHTRNKAIELGIRGWVRNCPDGSVEACLCGGQNQIEAMKVWLAHGPNWATVNAIRFSPFSPAENLNDFSIR